MHGPDPNTQHDQQQQTPDMAAQTIFKVPLWGVLKEVIMSCPLVGQTLVVPRRFCFQHCVPTGGTRRVEITSYMKTAIFRASFQVLTLWWHLRWSHTFFLTSSCSSRKVKAFRKACVSMCQPCADALWYFTCYLCVGTVVNSPGLLT